MKNIPFSILFYLLFILFSCNKEHSVNTIKQKLNEFDTLTINSVFDIEITQDSLNFIEITGMEKILSKILISNKNGNLILKNTFKGNWLYPKKNKIQINLHTDGLKLIRSYETSRIHSSNALTGDEIGLIMASKLNEADLELNCNNFYYWNNFPCGGKISLKGNVNNLKLWNVALMSIDAKELTCQNAIVENSSKGYCKLTCLQQLNCALKGEGDIFLWGNPPNISISEQSSTGKLIIQ